MAFESGFSAGLGLPMVDHPLAGLVEKLAGGYKAGAEMAAMPEQRQLANALRQAQIEQERAKAGLETEGAREKKMLSDYLERALSGQQALGGDGVSDLAETIMQKKLFGIEETPMQKQQREIETARLKGEQAKALEERMGTQASLSAQQSIKRGAEMALPRLEKLMDLKTPYRGVLGYVDPNLKAQYQSQVNALTDVLLGAYNLPKTNESIELVKSMVERQAFESDKAYQDRLKSLQKELVNLKSGKSPQEETVEYSEEDLRFTADKYGLSIEEVKERLMQRR